MSGSREPGAATARDSAQSPGIASDAADAGNATGRIVLRLDRMMVERGRSLNWLAEQVGITNVNLSKIKNNRVSAIRFSTLAAICEALDCQPGDILEYERD
ncbi:XRE family transcriptional regulator [Bifidobacterium eulemuris]|uniref:Helix-turn-helix transcriptional regulator n=2 Tax=Bifidobacterium eulemuris TaxID=1765219 RepID=A0A261GC02_9BIFI|nr:XRE family transcriptional regulator [Bifidobacterium eulemuris]QOL31507.1 helix-turn-helix transcriptional regulator [Bifidobacterium eulemuris]